MTQSPPASPRFDSLALARAALSDLWDARRFHVIISVIAILPRTLMDALGLLTPYYAGVMSQTMPPGYWSAALMFLIWAALWNTPMMVMWFRRFLTGPQNVLRIGIGQLAQRSLVFLAYSAGLFVVMAVVLMVIMLVLSAVTSIFTGMKSGSMPLLIIIVMGLMFFFGSRLMLTFAAIPLGKHISFHDSWKRTEGIAGPVIGALALCLMGSIVIAQLAYWLLATPILGSAGLPAGGTLPPLLHVIDILLAPLNYLATGLTAAITARVYHSITAADDRPTDTYA